MKNLKKVLSIAGSDSGGGAGIQADLKTFSARGVYGMTAITAVTAQNTVGVQGVFALPEEFVGKQIDSVFKDIGADAVKLGMLANADIVETVALRLKKYKAQFVVTDPVMVAKSGDVLLQKSAQNALLLKVLPLSYVVTPNLLEAESMTHFAIKSVKDMRQAAVTLNHMGAVNVVVKGGHLEKSEFAVDVLFTGKKFYEFASKRIKTENTHGTGCTFSSAIAAELAKGNNIEKSVRIAKDYLTRAIREGQHLGIGHGKGPLNHFVK